MINTSESILNTLLGKSQDSTGGKASVDGFNPKNNEINKHYDTLLSNSMFTEFNTPYSNNSSFTPELKNNDKMGTRTKSKSKENEAKSNINYSSQNNKVSGVKRIAEEDLTATTPVRHNMPLLVTQPKRNCNETPCMSRTSLYQGKPFFDVQSLYRPTFSGQK